MKRFVAIIMTAVMLLVCFTSCSPNTEKIKNDSSVIGIIAPDKGDIYNETVKIQEKYSAEKVLVETFNELSTSTVSAIYESAERLLANPSTKAIIFASGVEGTVEAIRAIKAARPDVECIAMNPREIDYYVSQTADLAITIGKNESCTAMVAGAKKAGMKTVVYLIPDKYETNKSIIKTGEALKAACEEKNVDYVERVYDAHTTDMSVAANLVQKTVAACVEEYGNDTAFYSSSCLVTDAVINAAAENEAGFIYGFCNCPQHHYKTAFGVDGGENYSQLLENLRESVDKNVRKKMCVIESAPTSVMLKVAMGYAIAYCNGSIKNDAAFDESTFKSAIKTALDGEEINDIIFVANEKYSNIINVGFPVKTL